MSDTIQVSDFLEAAVIRAARIPQSDCRLIGDRVVFEFSAPDAGEILQRHRLGELQLPTLAVTESISTVKSQMFNTRRMGGLR